MERVDAKTKPTNALARKWRNLAYLGVLVILGVVYVLLPASWFRIEEPQSEVTAPPKPIDIQELAEKAKASPSDPIARSRYGFALAASNRNAEAEAELRAAVLLAPRNATFWYNLGVFQLNTDNASESEKAFRRMER